MFEAAATFVPVWISTCWTKPYATLWLLLVLSEHTESQWEHCPYSVQDTVLFLAGPVCRECRVWMWPHVGVQTPSSHVLCCRATWKKQPLTVALKLPWLISQVQRRRKRGVVFLSSPHQFANWLWMGAILKHANVGSLCLYQLMQVSVVFGWALKAWGEKDVLRVRKGRINSSGITLPTLSMAEILWMDPLWGVSLLAESKPCQDPVH